MTPTSAAQAAATAQGGIPPTEEIAARVWVVPIPMPGGQPRLGYTLAYLLLDDEERVHVVDPGWGSDDNWDLLWEAVHRLPSRGEIASVIITHLHADHLGMASRLRAATGAPIVMHEEEAETIRRGDVVRLADPAGWGVPADRWAELDITAAARAAQPDVIADLVLRGDRDRLQPSGLDLEVLHTPGHTSGSICIRLPEQRLLLTGDHVLPAIHPGLGLGGSSDQNPARAYLNSLDRLTGFDDHEVLPGHNYRFRGLLDRIDVLEHRVRGRALEVTAALSDDPDASVFDVAARLTWTAGFSRLSGYFLYSALQQTAMYMEVQRSADPITEPIRSSR